MQAIPRCAGIQTGHASAIRRAQVERDGSLTPLVTGLTFPTALMAGRDGAFYVSNCGYHCDDQATGESLGVGQVLRISIAGAQAESLQ